MYKLLLCLRYLRTRYIALASIISVMLGVATMIVVNSVMSGFSSEMQTRIHGILADIDVEVRDWGGAPDPEARMAEIRHVAGDAIEGMTTTIAVPAFINISYGGQNIIKVVNLIGIDDATQSKVSDFSTYLQHPENRKKFSFELRDGGYDTYDHQAGPGAGVREQMKKAGWAERQEMAERQKFERMMSERPSLTRDAAQTRTDRDGDAPLPPFVSAGIERKNPGDREPRAAQTEGDRRATEPRDPFTQAPRAVEPVFDPAKQQNTGVVLGIAMANLRYPNGEERFFVLPGDDVKITCPTVGIPPKTANDYFTVVDFYECKMAEYDASFAFVPISKLQTMRGMIDPVSGVGMFKSIQIKLKPGYSGEEIRDRIARSPNFSPERYAVQTWRERQGALLAAVRMETTILNILLFFIIAVSGFGILAIFFMIVVEKTRDIGVLKSLGASGAGIMGIFVAYGLSLGVVGSGVGLVAGLIFVRHINDIADLLGKITGTPVFDPSIYYFYRIPTVVEPWTITWIVLGALAIAVLASVLPAMRAALLHPVEALRYE